MDHERKPPKHILHSHNSRKLHSNERLGTRGRGNPMKDSGTLGGEVEPSGGERNKRFLLAIIWKGGSEPSGRAEQREG